jgi:uncharacterized metal-binding protein YceD (DUF177 family)
VTPEFSRTVRTDTLGAEPRQLTIEANEQERTALARRFGLPAIAALTADAELNRNGETVVAVGTLRAEVTQSCVATALPVAAAVEEPFRILFRPQPAAGGIDEEVELGEADLDVVFYSSASVDIGEAIAETLALSLDPYPRAPGAEEVLKQAGVLGECEAGPFGALAGLKDKLAGG